MQLVKRDKEWNSSSQPTAISAITQLSVPTNNSRNFDVCVKVHHRYNNINSRLDATMIILLKFQSAQ